VLGDNCFDSKFKSIMQAKADKVGATEKEDPHSMSGNQLMATDQRRVAAPAGVVALPGATDQAVAPTSTPTNALVVSSLGGSKAARLVDATNAGSETSTKVAPAYIQVPIRFEMNSGHPAIGTFRDTVRCSIFCYQLVCMCIR
jgi:hypothetical protein